MAKMQEIIKRTKSFMNYVLVDSGRHPVMRFEVITDRRPTPEELASEIVAELNRENITVLQVVKYMVFQQPIDNRYNVEVELVLLVEREVNES